MTSKHKSELERAILALGTLLESGEEGESHYQLFFEKHQVVFQELGYKQAIPLTKQSGKSLPRDKFSDLKPEPDFIVERQMVSGRFLKLKRPS